MKSAVPVHEWRYNNLTFVGHSLSGIRTCISVPEWSFCFDVSQGYPFILHLKKFFITHGHLDHCAGVPYIISQKAMYGEAAPHFFMPESLVEPMTRIMQTWTEIEKHDYKFHFHPVNEKTRVELNQQYSVQAFKTIHRIDSFGYTLIHRNKKLLPEFSNLPTEQIKQAKKQGQQVDQIVEIPLVSFTGDTQIEVLDVSPEIKKSRLLFIEATYLDEKKSIAHAKNWGHTHLDEIIARLPEFENEKIVLIHSSSRYSLNEAQSLLKKKLPKSELDRVELFLGR